MSTEHKHQHQHEHDQPGDMDGGAWDAIYAEKPAMWSGEPNAQLVAQAADLTPGTALDVGCGEGADAVWLAGRGWDVTASDISGLALERARAHAASTGAAITFVQSDVTSDPPAAGSYDLVSAQFFQLPEPPRNRAMRVLGEAVSPGGHLLVVGHHPSHDTTSAGKPRAVDRLYAPQEISTLFPVLEWDEVVSETRERTAMHHGEMTDLVDTVVMLRRRVEPRSGH